MKKPSKSNTKMLLIILIVMFILAYKFIFAPVDDSIYSAEDPALQRVEITLQQLQTINFDTAIIEDGKIMSLQSIETPLISLPVGKSNPFSSSFNSN